MTSTTNGANVVTYQAPGSNKTIDVCPKCAARMKAAGVWPHDHNGREYCQVQQGLHFAGICETCIKGDEANNVW